MKLDRNILAEQIRITRLLLIENRMDFILTKFGPALEKPDFQGHMSEDDRRMIAQAASASGWSLHPEMGEKCMYVPTKTLKEPRWFKAEVLLDYVATFDPSVKKLYTQWLVTLLIKGALTVEDLSKTTAYLNVFDRFKARLAPEQRDINRYKSITDLYSIISPFEEEQTQGEIDREYDMKMRQESKVVMNTPEFKILIPLTRAAAIYYGRNTQWCTAASTTTNYFDTYNRQGPLYIILHKPSNTRWQFHMATGQFMDENDRSYNKALFAQTYPEVAEFFRNILEIGFDWIEEFNGVRWAWDSETNVLSNLTGRGLEMTTEQTVTFSKDGDFEIEAVGKFHDSFFVYRDKVAALARALNRLGADKNFVTFADNGFAYDPALKSWGMAWEIGRSLGKSGWRSTSVSVKNPYRISYGEPVIDEKKLFGYSGEDGELLYMLADEKLSRVWKAIEDDEKAAIAFAELMPYTPKDVRLEREASGYDPLEHMTPELKALVLRERPGVGLPRDVFELKGDTPLTRQIIDEFFEENEFPIYNWIDQGMIVLKFSNTGDLIEKCGNDDAKFAAKYVIEGDHYEINGVHVSDDQKENLLDSLDATVLAKIGQYFLDNFPDEIAEEFDPEFEDEFDPTSSTHIIKIIDAVGNQASIDIDQCFHSAVSTGEETGAESEMYNALKSALESLPSQVYWHNGKTYTKENGIIERDKAWGNYSNEYAMHDEEVVVMLTVKEVVALCNPKEAEVIQEEGWEAALDIKVDVEEPRYGWSDYDESSAEERFAEEVNEQFRELARLEA